MGVFFFFFQSFHLQSIQSPLTVIAWGKATSTALRIIVVIASMPQMWYIDIILKITQNIPLTFKGSHSGP